MEKKRKKKVKRQAEVSKVPRTVADGGGEMGNKSNCAFWKKGNMKLKGKKNNYIPAREKKLEKASGPGGGSLGDRRSGRTQILASYERSKKKVLKYES